MRAVIFDLWDTLVEWPVEEGTRLVEWLAGLAGCPPEEFARRLGAATLMYTGPLRDAYRELGIPEGDLEAVAEAHEQVAARTLRLREGAAEGLQALRRSGMKLGLISVCSEDVPARFHASDLAGLFDVETFSAVCGLMKPEPEIYLLTTRALGVEPEECIFVGDGANDELAGAARVGIEPVLFCPEGERPRWPEVRDWKGLRVSSIEEVGQLC